MTRIGHATLYIHRDQSDYLRLIDCDENFAYLSGLSPELKGPLQQVAYGDNANVYYKDYIEFIKNQVEDYYIHYFEATEKWLYLSMFSSTEANQVMIEAIDVTKYQLEVETLKLKELGYRHFVENSHGMAFQRMIKPQMQNLFTAGNFEDIIGYSNEVGESTQSWLEHIHPDDLEWVKKESEFLFGEKGYSKEYSYRVIRNDGEIRWVRTYDSNFYSEDGNYQIVQGLMFDTTEIKEQEIELKKAYETIVEQNRQLELLSNTDALTGMQSRRNIQDFAEKLIETSKEKTFVVILLDIDDFKNINDCYGHIVGDFVLTEFGRIIREALRKDDGFGRWGGEEFLIVLPNSTKEIGIEIGERLLKLVSRHRFIFENYLIGVTTTAGLTVYSEGKDFRQLYEEADVMLYKGKDNGKNQLGVY